MKEFFIQFFSRVYYKVFPYELVVFRRGVQTWLGAYFLAMIWSLLWLFVFFFSTWYLDIQTSFHAFAVALMMSVSAESVIRYAENAKWAVALSKPTEKNPKPDNADHNWFRAFFLFLTTGFLMVFLYGFFRTHFPDTSLFLSASVADDLQTVFEGDNCLAINPSRLKYLLTESGASLDADVKDLVQNGQLSLVLSEGKEIAISLCETPEFISMATRWISGFLRIEVLVPFMIAVIFRTIIYRRSLPKKWLRKHARTV